MKMKAVVFIMNLLEISTTIFLAEYLFKRVYVETLTFVVVSVFFGMFYVLPRLDTGTSIPERWAMVIACFLYPAALIDIESVKDIIFVHTIRAAYVTMSCMLPIVIGDVNIVFLSWLYSYICAYAYVSIYFKAIRSNIIQHLFSKDVFLRTGVNVWIWITCRRVLYEECVQLA